MISTQFKCLYCHKLYDSQKKLSNHTHDCFRKNTENPPERLCPLCNEDYTRKSGSAYRTHMKKCKDIGQKVQSESAVKQCERRKQNISSIICNHCNQTFENINVGQFGDHRYKCKKNIPNYDKGYQSQYREEIHTFTTILTKVYPNMDSNDCKKMCQNMRKLSKLNPNISEADLITQAHHQQHI